MYLPNGIHGIQLVPELTYSVSTWGYFLATGEAGQ